MGKGFSREYIIIVIVAVLLAIPALLINLGTITLIGDEGIRADVALEMKFSGDLITPKIADDYYYRKPPVYNYVLLLMFIVTDQYSEFFVRLPNIFILLAYCFSIYLVVKNRYGRRKGFLAAMLYLACGRVLFYESLFALIDISYSWLTFLSFIYIYHYFMKGKYLKMFLVSYTITAVTFLMKGYTSIAFQGITLLVIFISNKQFKKLFTWKHVIGGLVFIILTGSYYLAYYLKNPDQFTHAMNGIFHQSADKSAFGFSLPEVVRHVFTYSFEVFYNFMPGTLVLFLFIKKHPFGLLKKDPFLSYIIKVFIFNIIIFLISPGSFQRYVLMLMPLLFIVFVIYYDWHKKNGTIHVKLLDTLFLAISIVFCIGVFAFPMVEATGFVDHAWLKAAVLFIIMTSVIVWLFRKPEYRLEMLIIILLVVRIAFNFYILPSRVHDQYHSDSREIARKIGHEYKDYPVYDFDHHLPVNYVYYVTAERQKVIQINNDTTRPGYYFYHDPDGIFEDKTLYKMVLSGDGYTVSFIDLTD